MKLQIKFIMFLALFATACKNLTMAAEIGGAAASEQPDLFAVVANPSSYTAGNLAELKEQLESYEAICIIVRMKETILQEVDEKIDEAYPPSELYEYVRNCSVEDVQKLLEHGPKPLDLNTPDANGITPLHVAARRHCAIVKLLTDAGADHNAIDNTGANPLSHQKGCDTGRLILESKIYGKPLERTPRFIQTYAARPCTCDADKKERDAAGILVKFAEKKPKVNNEVAS